MDLSTKRASELKTLLLGAIARKDRDLIDRIRTETLTRAATVIGEGRDTPEFIRAVNRVTLGVMRKG